MVEVKTCDTLVCMILCLDDCLLTCPAQMLRLLADYTGEPEEVVLPETNHSKISPQDTSSTPLQPEINDEPSNSSLPSFLKPSTDRIAEDDLAYLRAKGAFAVPGVGFRDALIWSFFEYVHPLMPVLDIDQFLQSTLDKDGSSEKISLLLYQAVLFAGTAHVKMEYLQEAGFKTRRHARKVFFQRVRVRKPSMAMMDISDIYSFYMTSTENLTPSHSCRPSFS